MKSYMLKRIDRREFIMKYGIMVVSLLVTRLMGVSVLGAEPPTPPNQSETIMKENYQAAERRLAALTDSSDADALVQVGNEIDALSIGRKEDPRWNEWRRKKLDLWLKALDKMDRITDPHFDPNNAPSRNVAPPGVMGLRAGVSPDSIKDPNLRLEYERAIKQNAEKVTRYRLQYTIRRVEKDWGSKLKAYVDNHYTTEAKDLEELNTLIERNISNDSRKAQMKKEFTRKGGIGPR